MSWAVDLVFSDLERRESRTVATAFCQDNSLCAKHLAEEVPTEAAGLHKGVATVWDELAALTSAQTTQLHQGSAHHPAVT